MSTEHRVLWKFHRRFHGFVSVIFPAEIPRFSLCGTFCGDSTGNSTVLSPWKFRHFVSGFLDIIVPNLILILTFLNYLSVQSIDHECVLSSRIRQILRDLTDMSDSPSLSNSILSIFTKLKFCRPA